MIDPGAGVGAQRGLGLGDGEGWKDDWTVVEAPSGDV